MQFALNASTNVTFGGDRHLHTWLSHSFSGQQLPKLTLVAQARQFSSFIVLIGRIASANVFEPRYGMIVQNKDELYIPLNLEHLPTPKEFRDAIESLSPEQQRFAKAYRGMQLEGTLLGVLVLPIKPQLEVVLKLPSDILTKEIRLTQDLMELFIKYQIPSDLLSFDEKLSNGQSPSARLAVVKEHVKNMLTVIRESKLIELKEEVRKDTYNNPGGNFDDEFPSRMMGAKQFAITAKPPSLVSSMQSVLFAYAATPIVRKKYVPNAASSRAEQCDALRSCGVFRKIESETPRFRDSSFACEQADRESAIVTARVEKENPVPNMSGSDSMGNDGNSEKQKGNIESSSNAPSSSTSASAYGGSGASVDGREVIDFTKYAGFLDKKYEELDPDSALRPTIINPSDQWTKKSTKSLMSEQTTALLTATELNDAKQAAFELLDALTKSGALVMESASLHVVIAATHCFDKSLMDTVVQGNVNPIERVERSAVIMATTIHRLPASALLSDMEVQRVLSCSPQLQQLEY